MTLLRLSKWLCLIGLVLVIVTTLRVRNMPTPMPAPALGNLSTISGPVVAAREVTRKTVRNRMVVAQFHELTVDRNGTPVTLVLGGQWLTKDKVTALVGQVVNARFDASDANQIYTLAAPAGELVRYADVAKVINFRNDGRATEEPIFRGFAWVLFILGAIGMLLGWRVAWAEAHPDARSARTRR